MERNLSFSARAEINAPTNDDPFLYLLTLRAKGFAPIRIVNDVRPITSRGHRYEHVAFAIIEPPDDGETLPRARLTIDNVGLLLIERLRTTFDPIQADVELVLASDPDLVEVGYYDMDVRNVEWDQFSVRCDLTMEDLLGLAYPGDVFGPRSYPGLF